MKTCEIESNDPFIIRLLFSVNECGLKDSESLNKLNSGLLSEKEVTMCENEEIKAIANKLNEFYVFTLQSVRHILNSTDVDKVTWYAKNSANASGENDPLSFAGILHSAKLLLFQKNHRVMGNFVLIGKQGFEILKKIGYPGFVLEGKHGILYHTMKVHYIPSMEENRFIVSVYEPIDFKEDSDYKEYFNLYKKDNNYFQNMDSMIVGEIVEGEKPNENEGKTPKENIELKSEMDDKRETVDTSSIKYDSKTHLIFGYYGCGKTTYIRQLIKDKVQNSLGVCVLTNAYSAKMYFNKEDKNLHIFTIADVLTFLSDNEKNPTNIAKAIVNCFIANVGRFNIDTIAVDEMDIFATLINSDYSEDEYFRELSKCCKENKFNLLYTKGIDKIENDSSYHKIPIIFERFSDIITVLK